MFHPPLRRTRRRLVAAALPIGFAFAAVSGAQAQAPTAQGPCDIYAAGGTPCVAAHSTTRALYGTYNGPLYQVLRQSDGKTLDISVVQASNSDPGGYADADAQDKFCAGTWCWISVIYDQSPKHNHLTQAPRGGFSGPARAVAEAMKRYGLIVADNGSNWYISGSSDRRWDDENLDQLKRIPGNAFEAVKSEAPVHAC